jgi:8-oxo-dGTP diphosphatase
VSGLRLTDSAGTSSLALMSPGPRQLIRIAAAVITNHRRETLLVRKRGTRAFMQAGGKISAGESASAALARELAEELGCRIDPSAARPLGTFRALAANEAGAVVEAALFRVALSTPPRPSAEIEEIVWVRPDAARGFELAPLTRHHVLPLASDDDWPASAPRALFICKGNWFRSQMAAAIYNQLTRSVAAHSAGTYAGAPDEPEGQILADLFPTPHFFEAMEQRGMYVRANATRRLRPGLLDAYDLVVSMAEDPFVPDFLRADRRVIWWPMENPKVVDAAKAEEIFALVQGLVADLVSRQAPRDLPAGQGASGPDGL